MALKKTLALQRVFNNISSQILCTCRISAAAHVDRRIVGDSTIDPDPGDGGGVFRRFLHRRAVQLSSPLGRGENLMEKLRSLEIGRDRIRFDGLIPPPRSPSMLTAEESRKILKVAQMEMIKSKLREMGKIWVPYEEFVRVCAPDPEEGVRIGHRLDESGNVVVLGDMVLLHPELVTKAMAGIMPSHGEEEGRKRELEMLEKEKAEIDRVAEGKVRGELWGGLCGLVFQTTGLMRLTFWELSWDVMEPICFFITSGYCAAAFTFYILTHKEPSFENLFHVRFLHKQAKLMEARNFDLSRYHQLKSKPPSSSSSYSSLIYLSSSNKPASFSSQRQQPTHT